VVRLLKWLLALGGVLGLSAAAALAGAVWWLARDLPDHAVLAAYEPRVMSRVHAGDGTPMAVFARENRAFVSIEEVPAQVRNAFVSAEDQNFYRHPGIDPVGILKAAVRNVGNVVYGRRLHGASTITQQVAENMLLSRDSSLAGKIREGVLAWRIGEALSKDRVLELYLNEIYLGERAYGVAAAALRYFGKSLDDLELHETAYLAALPKGPGNYHPRRHPDRAVARRGYVLGRMAEDGAISFAEAEAASARPLGARVGEDVDGPLSVGGYFAEEVRREMAQAFGLDKLYEGGMSVRATMLPEVQRKAEQALQEALARFDREQGYAGPFRRIADIETLSEPAWRSRLAAMEAPRDIAGWRLAAVLSVAADGARIGVEGVPGGPGADWIRFADADWARPRLANGKPGPKPKSPAQLWQPGDVVFVSPADAEPEDRQTGDRLWQLEQLPEIQGAVMVMEAYTGRVLAMQGGFSFAASAFNRATQAERQPGSLFKPVVYAAALEAGFTPATQVLDAPLYLDQGPGLAKWTPANANRVEFAGPTPVRRGIEESRNLMTIRLAQAVGMDKVADYAHRLQIYESLPPLPANALGAGETTLEKLVRAYAVFANGGKRVQPVLVDRVQDRRGRTIYRRDSRPCVGCAAATWYGQAEPHVPTEGVEAMDPVTAFQVTWMLQGVVERGSGRAAAVPGRPLAGKTGTTNDSRDVWFVGYTPEVVVGCFMGYDEPRSLGRSAFGGKLCAPVVGEIVAALEPSPNARFRQPAGLEFAPVEHATGMRVEAGSTGDGIIVEAFRAGRLPPVGSGEGNVSPGTGGLF